MRSIVKASKRIARISTARLPANTKLALLRAELNRGREVPVRIGGAQVSIAAASHRIDYFTLYGCLIDRHFDWDVKGAAVLDIGAHKGYYAARALADGAQRVDSYEPASENVTHLVRAAARHPTWQAHAVAVGAESGVIELYISPNSWSHSVYRPAGQAKIETELVEMIPLSTALHDISTDGLPVVAKINVEGAAGSMILGTAPDDWDAVVSLWIDVEPSDPVGSARITQHLSECGLRRQRDEGRRILYVADGEAE